jgi:hypothetical protein
MHANPAVNRGAARKNALLTNSNEIDKVVSINQVFIAPAAIRCGERHKKWKRRGISVV